MAKEEFNDIDLPSGYSGSELKAASWWLEHKRTVGRVAIGLFIAFDAALIGYGAWGIFDWLAFNGLQEERHMRQLTSPVYAQLGGARAPQEIRFGSPIVLSLPDGRFDVVVPVDNPNPDHWVELTYRVIIGGEETSPRTDFVLPGQSKFLTELALRREGSPGRVELAVDSREWHRIDGHEIGDYDTYAARRQGLIVSDAAFNPGTGDEGSWTSFTIRNDTAFGYRGLGLVILLYRGDAVVGVNRTRLERLEAGETRDVDLFWFHALPQVTRTEVIPDVNILDEDVFIEPGA